MEHPIHILPSDGTLKPKHMRDLAENCSEQNPHPENPGLTVFTFRAKDVHDSRNRTIVADPKNGRYSADRADGCVCENVRSAIDCDCQKSTCFVCKQTFVAIANICDSSYCLYDECDLCTHQRETCSTLQIEQDIQAEYQKFLTENPNETQALAAYCAIAEILGAGSGDAPNFPIARKTVAALTSANPDDGSWTFNDGSVLKPYPPNHAWLKDTH